MYDTMELQTEPTQYATYASDGDDSLDIRIRESFANNMSDREKQALARDVASALLDDRERFGRWVTNKQYRRSADIPTPTDGGAVRCPGCREQGHTATVNVSALQTRHLPYLLSESDLGKRCPTDLLRVGCEQCNGDDGDAHKSHKRRCGTTCCN